MQALTGLPQALTTGCGGCNKPMGRFAIAPSECDLWQVGQARLIRSVPSTASATTLAQMSQGTRRNAHRARRGANTQHLRRHLYIVCPSQWLRRLFQSHERGNLRLTWTPRPMVERKPSLLIQPVDDREERAGCNHSREDDGILENGGWGYTGVRV